MLLPGSCGRRGRCGWWRGRSAAWAEVGFACPGRAVETRLSEDLTLRGVPGARGRSRPGGALTGTGVGRGRRGGAREGSGRGSGHRPRPLGSPHRRAGGAGRSSRGCKAAAPAGPGPFLPGLAALRLPPWKGAAHTPKNAAGCPCPSIGSAGTVAQLCSAPPGDEAPGPSCSGVGLLHPRVMRGFGRLAVAVLLPCAPPRLLGCCVRRRWARKLPEMKKPLSAGSVGVRRARC